MSLCWLIPKVGNEVRGKVVCCNEDEIFAMKLKTFKALIREVIY